MYARTSAGVGTIPPRLAPHTWVHSHTLIYYYIHVFLTRAHAHMYVRTSAGVGTIPPRLAPRTWVHTHTLIYFYIWQRPINRWIHVISENKFEMIFGGTGLGHG